MEKNVYILFQVQKSSKNLNYEINYYFLIHEKHATNRSFMHIFILISL